MISISIVFLCVVIIGGKFAINKEKKYILELKPLLANAQEADAKYQKALAEAEEARIDYDKLKLEREKINLEIEEIRAKILLLKQMEHKGYIS